MFAEWMDFGSPQWSGQVRQRLRVSLLVSAVCVAAAILVLRFPVARQAGPATELFVQLLLEEESVAETIQEISAEQQPDETTVDEAIKSPAPAEAVEESPEPPPPVDWYALLPGTAKAAVDRAAKTVSVNPGFDERRRLAAVQFAPSNAPQRTPIWENVEKDTLGRTILQSGDCYRVIDDPNVGSREAFETFGQYLAICSSPSDAPKTLPWVNEIRNRRASQARSVHPVAE